MNESCLILKSWWGRILMLLLVRIEWVGRWRVWLWMLSMLILEWLHGHREDIFELLYDLCNYFTFVRGRRWERVVSLNLRVRVIRHLITELCNSCGQLLYLHLHLNVLVALHITDDLLLLVLKLLNLLMIVLHHRLLLVLHPQYVLLERWELLLEFLLERVKICQKIGRRRGHRNIQRRPSSHTIEIRGGLKIVIALIDEVWGVLILLLIILLKLILLLLWSHLNIRMLNVLLPVLLRIKSLVVIKRI